MARREQRRSVLLASDVPYSRMLLRQFLEQEGCQVIAATGLKDALNQLAIRPFDLLVADLASSEGGCEQLLLRVRVVGAKLPVVLMVSNLDRDLLRRLSNLRPVGFLLKPVNMAALAYLLPFALAADEDLLVRSAELARSRTPDGGPPRTSTEERQVVAQMAESSTIDEQRLQQMFGRMPLLPHVVARILQISGDDESTVRELSEVISSDPRMAGQLLRIVNSAYFGFSRRIATIPEATVVLGTDAIRNLCVSAGVSNFFGGASEVLDRQKLWRHSLAAAIASRKVAERAGLPNAEEAFTAGLLHDLGRLALERHLPEIYGQVLQRVRESRADLTASEQQLLGLTHAWLSGWLARKWNLPAVLSEAMAWHHQPEAAAEAVRQVTAAVNLGNVLCHIAGLGGVNGVPPTLDPSVYGIGILNLSLIEAEMLIPALINETETLELQLSALL